MVLRGAIWTNLVVVLVPGGDDQAGLGEGLEPIEVQAFVPDPAIETLDIRVLDGLAKNG
jgi:hypothetical protein